MIQPELGPRFYGEPNRDIKSRMEAFYAQAITLNQGYWGQADIDTRFEAGDQTVFSNVYGNVPGVNRGGQRSFNRIRPIKNNVGGFQRRNRKSTIAVPVENGDAHTADQFTKILLWVHNQEGVLETISQAFDGALVTGLNFLHIWIDYRNDPISGNIKVDNCPYSSFIVDPYFQKHDLSDCNGIWRRSFLTRQSLLSLFPDKQEEIMSLPDTSENSGQDGKFQFMVESYNYGMRNLLAYDEFYYRDFRNQRMLADTQTGETTEWMGKDDETLELYLSMHPTVTLINQQVPTIRVAMVVKDHVLYDGPQIGALDEYPFVPVFAYYTPQLTEFQDRIQGIVRGLRDAQYLYNRRKVIELDILESQMNSGFIYKENALVNPLDVYQQIGQGRGIAIKAEASLADVIQIQSPAIPPTTLELSKILAAEMPQISGVNEELLGSAVDDKAGILSMLRQGAGLTTLQILFDQLDQSQKLLGRRMIELIQKNFTPGKIQKILQGEKPAPLFYSEAFGRYGCAVEEGLNTTTQKQMELAQRLQLREAGIPISNEDIMDVVTMQGKTQVMANIAKAQQEQQRMAQEQHQAAIAEQMARVELAKAKVIADQGLGMERISRIEENEALGVERRAEAKKDMAMAYLDIAKALKELEDVDLAHVQKLIALAQLVKAPLEKGTQSQLSAEG